MRVFVESNRLIVVVDETGDMVKEVATFNMIARDQIDPGWGMFKARLKNGKFQVGRKPVSREPNRFNWYGVYGERAFNPPAKSHTHKRQRQRGWDFR